MSYFAKPNFIIYDEWFDDNLEITKYNIRNKKIKKTSNIHEFYYEHSNFKVGASENNFKLELKVKENKLVDNNYFASTSEKFTRLSNNKFRLFVNHPKRNVRYGITKKLIYSLSIFSFIFIFGFLIFFISKSKKNQSNISNGFLTSEREFNFFKRDH